MKLNRLHAAILMVSMPFSVYPLGMGELTVNSYLNQPFKAEIPLIDVDGIPLNGIKANLASVEDFERIGLERNEILSFIQFEVKLNEKGKPVISLTSSERITEPFLQLVVDLAWAEGQLYRSYTILLDPPGYKLVTTVHRHKIVRTNTIKGPGVIEKPVYTHIVELPDAAHQVRQEASYGPTVANENIWQIAQRYVTSDSSLQQVILAIVGTNSQAFTQGNLNGLKIGERLRIPSNEEVSKIPADLAKKEVEAHDDAWKSGSEIKHVLLPPYIDAVAGTSQFDETIRQQAPGVSTVLPIPAFQQDKTTPPGLFNSILPKPNTVAQVQQNLNMKAEMDVNSAAIDTVRSENLLLKKQLSALQGDNKQLQQKMQQQNQEFSELKTQINQFLKERKGLKAQVHELNDENNGLPWWAYLLLIMGGAGMGMLMSLLINRKYREKPASAPVAASLPAKPWIESPLQTKPVPEIVESSAETIEPNPSPVEDSRVPEPEKSDSNKSAMPLEPDLLQVSPDETVKSSPMESPSESGDSNAVDENPDDEEKLSEADYTVEFEPGLYKNLVEKKESEPLSPLEADNNSVDFVLGETVQKNEGSPVESRTAEVEVQKEEPLSKDEEDFFAAMDLDEKEAVPEQVPISSHPTESPDEKQPDDDENAAALVKSKTALDTLLALAKTYISMDDLQAARQSLQEVAEYGSEEQKDQARKLLDELKEKD